jgi:hypothetical protein
MEQASMPFTEITFSLLTWMSLARRAAGDSTDHEAGG